MTYGFVWDRNPLPVALHGAPVTINVRIISYDIGPDDSGSGGPPSFSPDYSGSANVTVSAVWTPDDPSFLIKVYNGFSGTNPRGGTVAITITPTGVPSGQVVLSAAMGSSDNPAYTDPPDLTINLSGGVGSDSIVDTFHGVNGTVLDTHASDQAPDATWAGKIVGWTGIAAFSDAIQGNLLQSGGNNGSVRFARQWAAASDLLQVYADIKRKANPGGSGELFGIGGRYNGVSGNSDTGLDGIVFYATRVDDAHVALTWEQDDHTLGRIQSDLSFVTVAWARGDSHRLAMAFDGAKLFLLMDGALLLTRTLVTPWNDASHQYVGLIHTNYSDCVEYTSFFGGPLTIVAAQNPPSFESLQPIVQADTEPWESLMGISEDADAPWESLMGISEDADAPWEAIGQAIKQQGVPWDVQPTWLPPLWFPPQPWVVLDWYGGITQPSTTSTDPKGYWLRSTATGNTWQPYYAL